MKSERARENDIHMGRRHAMGVLARAPGEDLRRLWRDAGFEVEARALRGPETGQVTLRGRMGGAGAAFNIGEATVTRASIRLASGEVGHAYALGRDCEKVRIAAIVDALWQDAERREAVEERIVGPLAAALDEADARREAETAATRVDFFTMVRGED